jgi:hypothetical protein
VVGTRITPGVPLEIRVIDRVDWSRDPEAGTLLEGHIGRCWLDLDAAFADILPYAQARRLRRT